MRSKRAFDTLTEGAIASIRDTDAGPVRREVPVSSVAEVYAQERAAAYSELAWLDAAGSLPEGLLQRAAHLLAIPAAAQPGAVERARGDAFATRARERKVSIRRDVLPPAGDLQQSAQEQPPVKRLRAAQRLQALAKESADLSAQAELQLTPHQRSAVLLAIRRRSAEVRELSDELCLLEETAQS